MKKRLTKPLAASAWARALVWTKLANFFVLDFLIVIEVLTASGAREFARESDSVGDLFKTQITNTC